MFADKSSPIDLRALPVILFISLCINEARAPLIAELALLPSPRYIPDASIDTASFPRSSVLFVFSSLLICISSGASMINSIEGEESVCVRLTPHSKSTILPCAEPSETLLLSLSVAVMLSVGLKGSPVNSI